MSKRRKPKKSSDLLPCQREPRPRLLIDDMDIDWEAHSRWIREVNAGLDFDENGNLLSSRPEWDPEAP